MGNDLCFFSRDLVPAVKAAIADDPVLGPQGQALAVIDLRDPAKGITAAVLSWEGAQPPSHLVAYAAKAVVTKVVHGDGEGSAKTHKRA